MSSSSLSFVKKGIFYETYTYDSGELHPWTTWPTIHRGVGRDIHGISFLNQPLNHLNNH